MNSTIPIPTRVCSIFACPNNVWRPVFAFFNPINMLDPIQLVTASYGHFGRCASRIGPDRIIMPDPTSRIRFGSVFQRRLGSQFYCAKPGRVRSGSPVPGFAKRIWSRSKPVCKNHRARFWQDTAGQLPVSPLSDVVASLLSQTALIILCKTSWGPI